MPQNNISLELAKSWAKEYRKNPANKVIAHLIPRANLEQLLACSAGQDVRAYIGIDEHGAEKLMLVSVSPDGRDLIDESKGQLIYDNSMPNPPNSDIGSPLCIY
jgi:hypothetical protein